MINIAVMGYGVVGGGVVEVLEENASSIARNAGDTLNVKYILDPRGCPGGKNSSAFIKDFSYIERDPSVSVVAETIGGVGPAYDYTKRCLSAGKSVVTSNKELVATKGHELIAIARDNNCNYFFEASVGGGIPIIRPITQCLAANRITEIYGILNGTTNYILTQMIQCGETFENALADAQAKGFAERNPAADIEGLDACRKIAILSDLCFGSFINPDDIKTEGITNVSLQDVDFALRAGYKIKLIGRGLRVDGDRATAYVAPHLLPESSLLSGVDGVMNGIVVRGNALGEAMFYGAGAGRRPTASAVVADIIDAAKHLKTRKMTEWETGEPGFFADSADIESRWYLRSDELESIVGAKIPGAEIIGSADNETAYILPVMTRNYFDGLGIHKTALYRILD